MQAHPCAWRSVAFGNKSGATLRNSEVIWPRALGALRERGADCVRVAWRIAKHLRGDRFYRRVNSQADEAFRTTDRPLPYGVDLNLRPAMEVRGSLLASKSRGLNRVMGFLQFPCALICASTNI